jgi:hypothetical protein
MNKFPHDCGQLRNKYAGGGCDGDNGKVVGVGGVVVVAVIVLERQVRHCRVRR